MLSLRTVKRMYVLSTYMITECTRDKSEIAATKVALIGTVAIMLSSIILIPIHMGPASLFSVHRLSMVYHCYPRNALVNCHDLYARSVSFLKDLKITCLLLTVGHRGREILMGQSVRPFDQSSLAYW